MVIKLFLLQVLEEALHNGAIVGVPLCRERLNHVEPIKFFLKVGGGEGGTSVCVEHDLLGDASESGCILQCINDQKTADFPAHPKGNHFPAPVLRCGVGRL